MAPWDRPCGECGGLATHRDSEGVWCNSHMKDWDSARALND